jgi:hypothetical protein
MLTSLTEFPFHNYRDFFKGANDGMISREASIDHLGVLFLLLYGKGIHPEGIISASVLLQNTVLYESAFRPYLGCFALDITRVKWYKTKFVEGSA